MMVMMKEQADKF